MNKYIIYIGIIVIFIMGITIYIGTKANIKLKEQNQLYSSIVSDSLVKYKNAIGEQIVKSTVLTASNAKLLLTIKTKDSSIIALQNLIKVQEFKHRDVETALIFTTSTNIYLKDSLRNTISKYTSIKHGDSIFIYPTYTKDLNETNNWFNADIVLGLDSCSFSIKERNEYDIVIGTERDGLFKSKSFVELTNHNPYVDVKTMKVFEKDSKINKSAKTGFIMGGVGVIIGLLIHLL